jgi:hypothetical protein
MVRWFIYSWICCWLLVTMPESTTPTNSLIQGLVDKLIYQSGWHQEWFGKDKDKREDVVPPPKEEIPSIVPSPSIVSPKAVEIPQGYADTTSNIHRNVEPFNMNIVARIEGGPEVLSLSDDEAARWKHPVSGATGPWQVKPELHGDVGTLKWYGATSIKPKEFETLTLGQQRGHANKYLIGLLGKYSDRLSGTNTWKKQGYDPETNKFWDDLGADSKGRWDVLGNEYIPRQDVKGARATALAAYNLGPTNMDYMLNNKRKITGKPFKYKYNGKPIEVKEAKLEELRGYLGKYVAEGELTKQEVLDAFPEMKNLIDGYIDKWHGHNLSRQRR